MPRKDDEFGIPYAPGHEPQKPDAYKLVLGIFFLPYILATVPVMIVMGKGSSEAMQRANEMSKEYLGIDLDKV